MKQIKVLKLHDKFDEAVIGLREARLIYDHIKVIIILIEGYKAKGFSEERSIDLAHDDFSYNYLAYFVENCPIYD